MNSPPNNPRILVVTPEVTYLPNGMSTTVNGLSAKAGGLADVSAALISALFTQGADVHVALPDYRTLFGERYSPLFIKKLNTIKKSMPDERIHLAQDRAFFYVNSVYSCYEWENAKISLAFQREVINNIIPHVQPDLIHCHDWMTGLIPAMARHLGIPCLFTVHNIHTVRSPLSYIEDRGIDAALFWDHLFYDCFPSGYEQTRDSNLVDFLTSGIFAAHFVNTVSPTFLMEVIKGEHDFVEESPRRELRNKWDAGCASGILNAPDPSFNPSTDKDLVCTYGAEDHIEGKRENKRYLQKTLRLIQDEEAPLFFWPSRLDMIQKGCQLLSSILYEVVSKFWDRNLQIVFVANGVFQSHFKEIVQFHGFNNRVVVKDFDEKLARLAYAASDFVLLPSLFEPCGLPQMIGPIYGSLPVAHDTGGIHDTSGHMDVKRNAGNGFLFKTFDPKGLFWAVKQAMAFYNRPQEVKEGQIKRIMKQSTATFNHDITARQYIALYEKMLQRPLINNVHHEDP